MTTPRAAAAESAFRTFVDSLSERSRTEIKSRLPSMRETDSDPSQVLWEMDEEVVERKAAAAPSQVHRRNLPRILVPVQGPRFDNPMEMVTFHVGKDKDVKKFMVHEEVACYYSSVLKAAFKGNFQEGKTKVYVLEDVEEGEFKLLVQWLYSGATSHYLTQAEADSAHQPTMASTPNRFTHNISPSLIVKITNRQIHLINLWILAERLQIRNLCDAAADELELIRVHWDIAFPNDKIAYAYENTSERSPLRELIVGHILDLRTKDLEAVTDKLPKECLVEVVGRMNIDRHENHHMGMPMNGDPRMRFYHYHRDAAKVRLWTGGEDIAEPVVVNRYWGFGGGPVRKGSHSHAYSDEGEIW